MNNHGFSPLANIVPPYGDGNFPPYGIDAVVDLSNGERITGRMVHLCDLSPQGLHTVAFVADREHKLYGVFYVGAVPHQLGPPCRPAVVVVAWDEIDRENEFRGLHRL